MVDVPEFEYGEEPIKISKSMYCAKCMSEMKCIREREFRCLNCGQRYIEEKR